MIDSLIDDYISQFTPEVQEKLRTLRAMIHLAAPEATEKISYQMPTFYLNGNLVHFAAHKGHIGFYPTPSGIQAFPEEYHFIGLQKGRSSFHWISRFLRTWSNASSSSVWKKTRGEKAIS